MSARRKTPTADENKRTAIFDSGKHRRKPDSQFPEHVDPTVVDGPLARSMHDEPAAPVGATTMLDAPAQPIQVISKKDKATGPIQSFSMKDNATGPLQAISKKDNATGPIQAISMKTPGAQLAPEPASQPTPMVPRPKLRAMSEMAPVVQQNLGHVAPPYDPEEARARKVREYVIWGCVAVILASVIALVVWFAAR